MLENNEGKFALQTSRFGEIVVDMSSKIDIIGGLLGFPDSTRFIVLDHEQDSPFKWLQSIDEGEVAFVICDPLVFFPDYRLQIRKEELANMKVDSIEDFVIFVILSLYAGINDMTANLQGPIIVNAKHRKGRQIVLKDSGYKTRHRLFPDIENEIAAATEDAEKSGG
jgi:flagellar assembly factor FliW